MKKFLFLLPLFILPIMATATENNLLMCKYQQSGCRHSTFCQYLPLEVNSWWNITMCNDTRSNRVFIRPFSNDKYLVNIYYGVCGTNNTLQFVVGQQCNVLDTYNGNVYFKLGSSDQGNSNLNVWLIFLVSGLFLLMFVFCFAYMRHRNKSSQDNHFHILE